MPYGVPLTVATVVAGKFGGNHAMSSAVGVLAESTIKCAQCIVVIKCLKLSHNAKHKVSYGAPMVEAPMRIGVSNITNPNTTPCGSSHSQKLYAKHVFSASHFTPSFVVSRRVTVVSSDFGVLTDSTAK